MIATQSELRPGSGQHALLWIPVGSLCIPVEVTVHTDVVEFETPDWVPDTVLDSAHNIVFGEPV